MHSWKESRERFRSAPALVGLLLVMGAPVASRAQTANQPMNPPPAGQNQAAPPAGQAAQVEQAPGTSVNAQDRIFDDSQYGINVAFPGNWQQGKNSGVNVPGEVRAVWSPDGTTTIVMFIQKPKTGGKPVNPWILLDQSADALQQGLKATVDTREVRDVGGLKAMWLVITGNGTGAAIDGKGTVPTSQHWVAIPRTDDMIILLLNTPQGNFSITDPVFQTMLGTMKITGTQAPEQQVEAHLKPAAGAPAKPAAPSAPSSTTPPPASTATPPPPPAH